MEGVVGAEPPAGHPHEHVIPHAEEPHQRKVSERNDASSVRDISQQLI